MHPEPVPKEPPARRGRSRRTALAAGIFVAGAVSGGFGVAAVGGGSGRAAAPPAATLSTPPAPSGAVSARAPGRTIAEIYRAESAGVVTVVATGIEEQSDGFPFGQPEQASSEGTGFVVDRQGHILTNEHVVEGARAVSVSFADGRAVRATITGTDSSNDLALLQVHVPASALDPLPLGTVRSLSPGDPVIAIGNPFGYARSVSAGIVSGLDRDIEAPNGFTITGAIQTDAAINHGNSGGPLLDGAGRVVGITAQIADSGVDANVGVGFAVPIDAATRELRELASGNVTHAWLGIAGQTVTPAVAAALGLGVHAGVLVTGVVPGSPAAHAGLQGGSDVRSVAGQQVCAGGDVITAIGGKRITSMSALSAAIASDHAGDGLDVRVTHPDGTTATVHVTLAAQPTSAPSAVSGCTG